MSSGRLRDLLWSISVHLERQIESSHPRELRNSLNYYLESCTTYEIERFARGKGVRNELETDRAKGSSANDSAGIFTDLSRS